MTGNAEEHHEASKTWRTSLSNPNLSSASFLSPAPSLPAPTLNRLSISSKEIPRVSGTMYRDQMKANTHEMANRL